MSLPTPSNPAPSNMPAGPLVMDLPPGNLDMSLRWILDHSHAGLQISRMSSWRFAWPAGIGHYVTTYPCNDDIVRDLQDGRSGQKRPFGPYQLSVMDTTRMLCAPHYAPASETSFARASALNRLRQLKNNPRNHIFWGDLAFKASPTISIVCNLIQANSAMSIRYSRILT